MSGKKMIRTMYDYNYWANDRLLEGVEKLAYTEFSSRSNYSHGSLRDTLFHILRTEWVWRNLAQEQAKSMAPLRPEEFQTIEKLREFWQEEKGRMLGFIDSLSDENLAGSVNVRDSSGGEESMVLWHMLMHPVMHGMQHRSEAAAILTGYGQSPGDLDFIFYV